MLSGAAILCHFIMVSGSERACVVASMGVVPELLQNPSSCRFREITPEPPQVALLFHSLSSDFG